MNWYRFVYLEWKGFLVKEDYYSNFWEIDELESTTSETVIEKLKAHFARYGSPTSSER